MDLILSNSFQIGILVASFYTLIKLLEFSVKKLFNGKARSLLTEVEKLRLQEIHSSQKDLAQKLSTISSSQEKISFVLDNLIRHMHDNKIK